MIFTKAFKIKLLLLTCFFPSMLEAQFLFSIPKVIIPDTYNVKIVSINKKNIIKVKSINTNTIYKCKFYYIEPYPTKDIRDSIYQTLTRDSSISHFKLLFYAQNEDGIWLVDILNKSASEALKIVSMGYAFVNPLTCKNELFYINEEIARKLKLGIWKLPQHLLKPSWR